LKAFACRITMFNLLPFAGQKIFEWNKLAYEDTMAMTMTMVFIIVGYL
jgi:hypothetical protein